MDGTPLNRDLLLENAQALIASLESPETSDQELEAQIDVINNLRDNSLFNELGKMTREIHDSIMRFRMDNRQGSSRIRDRDDRKSRQYRHGRD